MPMYAYVCRACGHSFEELQKFADDPIRECPECGELEASRVIARTHFALKGRGWYKDLYAKPKP